MAMQAGGRVHAWVHGGCVMGSATSGSAACRCRCRYRYRYSHGGTDGAARRVQVHTQTQTQTPTGTHADGTGVQSGKPRHTGNLLPRHGITYYPDTASPMAQYHDYDQPCVLSGTARLVFGFALRAP
jgi:hypothetical protein